VPVDLDSRIQLLRHEPVVDFETEPVWSADIERNLTRIIDERTKLKELEAAGLQPTKTALFVGPPGVGKTLAAKWLSVQLKKPLFILDLSAVMSSYLGRTGTNLRLVLDYAKSIDCIILLDEIDAIAKKRDDFGEVGELKRLVTVLLQEIDDWPSNNLMLAATNHPNLLDPALWRRFDHIIDFPLPGINEIHEAILRGFEPKRDGMAKMIRALSIVMVGSSFSDVGKLVMRLKRASVLDGYDVEDLIEYEISERVSNLSRDERRKVSVELLDSGLSQRKISLILGMGRDTIRKAGI
jgi:SpoVK/Ycf46/Vps4 family AAA+-type ATPase